MKVENEQQLLQKWMSGDREAFGELFSQVASRLYSFALRLTRNPEDTRDVLQTAAFNAFSSGFPNKGGTNFNAWMHRIVLNLFLDGQKYKKRAGRQALLDGVDWEDVEFAAERRGGPASPRKALEERQEMAYIEEAIGKLSPQYRSVVVLRDVEGFSYDEIATIEGIPMETVRTRLRRARTQLRKLLAPLWEQKK